jgi:2-dehydropantoate 2-reductase
VSATSDPAAAGVVDLVVVGVKTYDLDMAAEQMRPLLGPETVVLPLENGIDAAERLARVIGPGAVLGGVAYVSSFVNEPGVVRHVALNTIILGELNGQPSARVERVAQVLRGAGIGCETPPDIRVALWEKFIFLAGIGGVMAVTRLTAGPLRQCEAASALFRGAMDEAWAVGRAAGMCLAPDLVERKWQEVLRLPAGAHGSMLQDLKAGRRLELEALNGTVVRRGGELSVPTPLNFAVYAALKPYANGALAA